MMGMREGPLRVVVERGGGCPCVFCGLSEMPGMPEMPGMSEISGMSEAPEALR